MMEGQLKNAVRITMKDGGKMSEISASNSQPLGGTVTTVFGSQRRCQRLATKIIPSSNELLNKQQPKKWGIISMTNKIAVTAS